MGMSFTGVRMQSKIISIQYGSPTCHSKFSFSEWIEYYRTPITLMLIDLSRDIVSLTFFPSLSIKLME